MEEGHTIVDLESDRAALVPPQNAPSVIPHRPFIHPFLLTLFAASQIANYYGSLYMYEEYGLADGTKYTFGMVFATTIFYYMLLCIAVPTNEQFKALSRKLNATKLGHIVIFVLIMNIIWFHNLFPSNIAEDCARHHASSCHNAKIVWWVFFAAQHGLFMATYVYFTYFT